MSEASVPAEEAGGIFTGLFGRGAVRTGDEAWLQAMLDAEAGLARALERAGLAPAGAGAAVTAAADASRFDAGDLGRRAALTGNPVPPLARALAAAVPGWAAGAVHHGATSQDILDTAAMLVASRALDAILADLAGAAAAAAVLGKIARDVTLLAQSEVAEVREGGTGRGGSSAMPQKSNPVASVLILGCTRRAPGLLATLAAAAEQEHQRAAGGWHAEWEPLADLLRLTGSAASWGAELLAGLAVDARRMRANLDAAGGFPMAGRVAALLAPALGPAAAHDLIAAASADAAAAGQTLGTALRAGAAARALAEAGVTADQVGAALDPVGYLGSARTFTDAALAAHRELALPAAGGPGNPVPGNAAGTLLR